MKEQNFKLMDIVVTAAEMVEIDRNAIDKIGIPGMVLMETAGRKVVELIQQKYQVTNKIITVVCGKGNNGGDGFVIARDLHNLGAHVHVYLAGDPEAVKGDAKTNLIALKKLQVEIKSASHKDFSASLAEADLIVDALLGTGVIGQLKPEIANLVEKMNLTGTPIIAVDLPTGMETDTGAIHGACVQAAHTITMGHLKRGLLFSPGREFARNVHVADIGFPKINSQYDDINCFRINREFIKNIFPQRARDAFKNRVGQVFLLAGSPGMTGAACLASEAVLRVGAGLAILGIPKSLNPILEAKLTEVMTLPLLETETGSVSFEAKNQISERLEWAHVLALGPGLTAHPDVRDLVKWLLWTYERTIILDADALNCLQNDSDVVKKSKAELILTPHVGELSRLMKMKTSDITKNPIEVTKQAAKDLNAVIVLKGAPTVIASPDGGVFINSTGNPGMATAGMGDVLTGMISGLSAQSLSPIESAIAGVYLHGFAGDTAAQELGQSALLAGDILKSLPGVLKEFDEKNEDGIDFI